MKVNNLYLRLFDFKGNQTGRIPITEIKRADSDIYMKGYREIKLADGTRVFLHKDKVKLNIERR